MLADHLKLQVNWVRMRPPSYPGNPGAITEILGIDGWVYAVRAQSLLDSYSKRMGL